MLFLLPKDNIVQSPHERGPLVLDFSPLKTMSQTNFGSLWISLSAILWHQHKPEEALDHFATTPCPQGKDFAYLVYFSFFNSTWHLCVSVEWMGGHFQASEETRSSGSQRNWWTQRDVCNWEGTQVSAWSSSSNPKKFCRDRGGAHVSKGSFRECGFGDLSALAHLSVCQGIGSQGRVYKRESLGKLRQIKAS